MKIVYRICLLAIFIIFHPGCEKQNIPVQITMFNIEDGLPNQYVRGLAEDNFWDTIYIEHYPDSNCTVYEVLLDSKGDFWVTTPDYCFTGVYRYNGREWTDYNTREIFSGEIGNSLYGLIETNQGDILISAGSHIIKFSDDEWSIYFDLNSLAEYRLLATMDLYADSRDNIWFPITDLGSFEGMLYSYNGKELNKFDLSPFPYSGEQEIRMVNCIYEDSKENIWVGTTDGLFKIVK